MRTLLTALAVAGALPASTAAAQPAPLPQSGDSHWSAQSAFAAGHGDRFHHGRDGLRGRVVAVTQSYGGEWALYNNRSWAPDSYNDWWHDRPDRAFPRWVQSNGNCERVWWSGGGWRC